MKARTSILSIFLGMTILLSSCDTLQQVANEGGILSNGGTPTAAEMSSGLKQALQIGLQDGVKQVSAVDGFFKNPLIKIAFPPDAQKVESALRSIGLNQLCDNVTLSLNRAAENASKEATTIFLNALKQMSFQDVTQILLGPDTAATGYFKRVTTSQLKAKFEPIVANNLGKVGATRYWSDVMTKYNSIPLVKPINPDLNDYVTQQAINGLFVMIAGKEKQIRQNISARTTPLLQKVFGYAAQQKGKG